MNNVDSEIEQMLAKPEFLADPVFSKDIYLSQVTYAMMGRFLRAANQPKELFDRVQQKHVDEVSACAMTGISANTSGIFIVWAFDLDKQGPKGQFGRIQFIERAKRPGIGVLGTSSTEILEQVLMRGVLRIQTDSPEHPSSESKEYQICQLKNVGWYVAGLVPPSKSTTPTKPPTEMKKSWWKIWRGQAPSAAPEQLLQKGMDAGSTRRWTEALANFDQALKLNPNYGEAWFRR
jgi:hypothetical protein